MKKTIYPLICSLMLVMSCQNEKITPITKPELQTPPYLVDIEYPETLPEEMSDFSKNPKPYKPIMVKKMSTSYAHEWNNPGLETKTRIIHNMVGYEPKYKTQDEYEQTINQYGSSTLLPRQEATGRYYTKKIDDRWWIVDPEGYLQLHRAVTSFHTPEGHDDALIKKYGNKDNWARLSVRQLASMGFHAAGGFSNEDDIIAYNKKNSYQPMTYTAILTYFLSSAIAKAGWKIPDDNNDCRVGVVFKKDFPTVIRSVAKEFLDKYKGDKNMIGLISDNELMFSANRVDVMKEMLELSDEKFEGKKVAMQIMSDHGLPPTAEAYVHSPQRAELQNELSGKMAEAYYKACHDAIKEIDPNILYMGSRLHGKPKTQSKVIEAAGKYCDIITINYYGHWTPELKGLVDMWENVGQKPFMVTEFYSLSDDVEKPNNTGAGWLVQNARDKGFFYQNFTLALLESKNCVGWTWFRYIDGEATNQGIFDLNYNIYPEVGTLARELNYNAYDLIEYFDN